MHGHAFPPTHPHARCLSCAQPSSSSDTVIIRVDLLGSLGTLRAQVFHATREWISCHAQRQAHPPSRLHGVTCERSACHAHPPYPAIPPLPAQASPAST